MGLPYAQLLLFGGLKMKKTYRTINWGTDIDIFDVVKETDATIWIKKGEQNKIEQYRKMSDSYQYFDTIEGAKKHLTDRYLKDIEYYEKQIERANEALKKVQAID